MPKVKFTKKARTDIYQYGKRVQRKNRKGENVTRVDRSQPENKDDKIIVKKGESYYWWMFNFSHVKHISLTRPRQSQLTQSDFLSQFYSIQEQIEDLNADNYSSGEDIEGEMESITQEIESLKDECQDKLDSMPEQLQESSDSGILLQERIDALESWYDELTSIDYDDVEPDYADDIRQMTEEELKEYAEENAGDLEEDFDTYKDQAQEQVNEEAKDRLKVNGNNIYKNEEGKRISKKAFILLVTKNLIIDGLRKPKIQEKIEEIQGIDCVL